MFSVHERLPILSTIPRSGTWFLRYAISFLCHLDRGGCIEDRLTGEIIGDPSGPRFDFERFKGGPLFRVQDMMASTHLFIGHTVCPGYIGFADEADWWRRTNFHVPGYNYLHEGLNYRYTPVDLAPYDYTPVRVATLERSAWAGRSRGIVLVYRNPLEQAASYFRYCRSHTDSRYNSFKGRPLCSVPFRDYLFQCGLPSYAKQFISFQSLAKKHPHLVRLVSYERLVRKPVGVLTTVLDHLAGAPGDWVMLEDAVRLARPDHMKAIEKELGRSLDGTRAGRSSHITRGNADTPERGFDGATYDEAMTFLHDLGLDTGLFESPVRRERALTA